MKTLSLILVMLSLGACVFSVGQQPSPTVPPLDEGTVKITTSLIQFDVVVTDKKGNVITDLKPEDFQVYQDGKLQTLAGLSYVNGRTSQKDTIFSKTDKTKKRDKLPVPGDVRSKGGRIITVVLDDANGAMSFGEMNLMIDTMRKFVDEQMLPDDRVGIYRTASGSSLIPIYTSNKAVLNRVLSKIHLPTPFYNNEPVDKGKNAPSEAFSFRFTGSLFVLKTAIERLRNRPERKIVFLLSSSLPLNGDSNPLLREIIDLADRSSAVINTIGITGLTIPGSDRFAAEFESGPSGTVGSNPGPDRQGGMFLLADTTGGTYIRQNNFPVRSFPGILERQSSYYLLSYEPGDETFKSKMYHKIQIKMIRPDLKVNSRDGFYGRSDAETRPVYKTADSPLYQAMDSPLGVNGIDLGLTVITGNDPVKGNFIRPLFHISGEDLTLVDDVNGSKKVVLDMVAVTLDEGAKMIDQFNRTYTTHIPREDVELAQRNGLEFSADMGIKKTGMYSFRIAVRDATSKKIGSAGDYFEINDLRKGKFYIGGLITSGNDGPQTPTGDGGFSLIPTLAAPSVRQYNKGSSLFYTYTVYNAKIDKASGLPTITRQVRLFHNGKVISDRAETSDPPVVPVDSLRINKFGSIFISDQVEPGEYALQIVVRDKLANKVVSQWIDFEVTP